MGQLYDAMILHMEENNLKFQRHDEAERLMLGIGGRNGRWQIVVQVNQAREQVTVLSMLESHCPPERLPAMCEFLTRANWGLILGNYEMDLQDGEIRYKTSVDMEGQVLPQSMIRPLMAANISTVDRYFPGLMRVMFGDGDARMAVRECEPSRERLEAELEELMAQRGRSHPSRL